MTENMDKRKEMENSEAKTELANRIAGQSRRVAST